MASWRLHGVLQEVWHKRLLQPHPNKSNSVLEVVKINEAPPKRAGRQPRLTASTCCGPSMEEIPDRFAIPTRENDVLHSLVVVRVGERSLDPTATGIEVTQANFQGEKEEFRPI